jgi:hypothetical protein
MTSHAYITINLFNLCQHFFLPFHTCFSNFWRRLNEPGVYVTKIPRFFKQKIIKYSTQGNMAALCNKNVDINFSAHTFHNLRFTCTIVRTDNVNHYDDRFFYFMKALLVNVWLNAMNNVTTT